MMLSERLATRDGVGRGGFCARLARAAAIKSVERRCWRLAGRASSDAFWRGKLTVQKQPREKRARSCACQLASIDDAAPRAVWTAAAAFTCSTTQHGATKDDPPVSSRSHV